MLANVNTTTNGTQLWSCSYNPTARKIGGTFAYCLISVVSLAGNSLVGIMVYKTEAMRKPINFLIVNIAMADLLYSIFLIPQKLTELNAGFWLIGGTLGQALCKLGHFLRHVSLAVSNQSLVLITVDRFKAVVFPLRSPLVSSKRCPLFIFVTWIVAMATWTPYLISNKLVTYQKSGGPEYYECESTSYKIYMSVMFASYIYTPLVLVAILYTVIYFKVKSLTLTDEQSANERQPLIRRERTVLKVAIAIVLGFAVCWLPWSIVFILAQLVRDMSSCSFQYFVVVAFFMARANCAINPCILFLVSKNYRQSIRNLFRCFRALQE